MAESAAHPVDEVIPRVLVRQWVLSHPIPLRILFAAHPELLAPVLRTIHRVIAGFLHKQAGLKRATTNAGAVTLIQRFGSAANYAGVRCSAHQRQDLERLCRTITRPAIANERLKRVFDLDLEHCPQCGGEFRIIAAIEEHAVIVRILTHLGLPARAPPRSPARPLALFQAA